MLAVLLPLILAPSVWTFQLGSLERTALVFAPALTKNAPVVLCFHGHGGGSRQSARSFAIHAAWPEALVIYPQGLPTIGKTDPEGKKPGWQKQLGEYGDRDLEFVDAMLKRAKGELHVDSKRIFAMGHSNGGAMTYLLFAVRPNEFAAFGPSGAYRFLNQRMTPKPLFHITGEKDPLVDFQMQSRTIEQARRLNKCDENPTKSGKFLATYASKSGTPVATYITPGKHEYPTEASAEMVKFFRSVGNG